MSSESLPVAEQERRLHPLSFVFTLIQQLKQFALPLIVLLISGQRSNNPADQYAFVGVVVMALFSIAQYFTFRYRIEADSVVVRSGVFQRSLRHIPFARIQNVSLHQNVLHRLFRVAEVRLESAGSSKPEAQMRVLRMRDAQALERQIRAGGAVARAIAAVDGQPMPEQAAPTGEHLLLALPFGEVMRLGLVSNRGMVIVGAGFAALSQVGNNLIGKMFEAIGHWLSGHASAMHLSTLALAGAGLLMLLLVLVVLRVLGIVWSVLQFHGFRLTEGDGRLSVERGLLTRVRASLPRHRIQAWTLHEGILLRWLGRRSLRVDSAVVESGTEKRSLRDLAPIATPAAIDALVAGLLPARTGATWPLHDWRALHPDAWQRELLWPALVVTIAAIALALLRTPHALWGLLLLPLFWWSARNWAKHSAWSVDAGMVAFRSGWLGKNWRFAETRKLQAIELKQSPIDRRFGMATLHFDTAGAGSMEPALAIPYLPEATARKLYDELAATLR